MSSPETFTIEKLVYGGAGLARTPERVTMTNFVAPGEQIRAEIVKQQKGFREARLLEVVEPSPSRVAPVCGHFQTCGGCHYQHLNYDAQIEAKREILRESLQRIGKFTPPTGIGVLSGEPYGYRNRIQLHLDRARIGYKESRSHKLVPVKECPIASPMLQSALAALRERVHHPHFPKFIREIELFSNGQTTQFNIIHAESGVQKHFFEWMAEVIPGAADSFLEYPVGADRFRVSYQSFFQVNRFLLEPLVDLVTAGAKGDMGVDLYAGVGLFSLPLARKVRKLTAVEVVRGAARDLEFNAAEAQLNISVLQTPAEDYLVKRQTPPDFVIADPPRAGLGQQAVRELLRWKSPAITIVSCDPTTLARDLAGLLAGGYEIEDLTMVDMFPQTFHIESVTRLRLA